MMFLKTYTEIPAEFDAVRAAILQPSTTWLDDLGDAIEQAGEHLLAEVGIEADASLIRPRAECVLGQPQVTDRVASLPILLRIHGPQSLFRSFYGSLDAAWLGPVRTQLALSLHYESPVDGLGRTIDQALLHRVAETAARTSLEQAARRLVNRMHAPVPTRGRARQQAR